MTQLDNNIAAVTKAARTIEKKLCETEMQPMAIVASCKQMQEYIGAANLLTHVKAVVQPDQIIKKPNLFKL